MQRAAGLIFHQIEVRFIHPVQSITCFHALEGSLTHFNSEFQITEILEECLCQLISALLIRES